MKNRRINTPGVQTPFAVIGCKGCGDLFNVSIDWSQTRNPDLYQKDKRVLFSTINQCGCKKKGK